MDHIPEISTMFMTRIQYKMELAKLTVIHGLSIRISWGICESSPAIDSENPTSDAKIPVRPGPYTMYSPSDATNRAARKSMRM